MYMQISATKCITRTLFPFRLLVRSAYHYVHGVVGVGELVGGELGRVDREEVIAVLAREMALETAFKAALFPDIQRDLLKIDEVHIIRIKPLYFIECNTGCMCIHCRGAKHLTRP